MALMSTDAVDITLAKVPESAAIATKRLIEDHREGNLRACLDFEGSLQGPEMHLSL